MKVDSSLWALALDSELAATLSAGEGQGEGGKSLKNDHDAGMQIDASSQTYTLIQSIIVAVGNAAPDVSNSICEQVLAIISTKVSNVSESPLPISDPFRDRCHSIILAHVMALQPCLPRGPVQFGALFRQLILPILAHPNTSLQCYTLAIGLAMTWITSPSATLQESEAMIESVIRSYMLTCQQLLSFNTVQQPPTAIAQSTTTQPASPLTSAEAAGLERILIEAAQMKPAEVFGVMAVFVKGVNTRREALVLLNKFVASNVIRGLAGVTRLMDALILCALLDTNAAVVVASLNLLAVTVPSMMITTTNQPPFISALTATLTRCVSWEVTTTAALKLSRHMSQPAQLQSSDDLEMQGLDGLEHGGDALAQSILSDAGGNMTPASVGGALGGRGSPVSMKSSFVPTVGAVASANMEGGNNEGDGSKASQKELSNGLLFVSAGSVRRAVANLFTVLYGILPVSVITAIREFCESDCKLDTAIVVVKQLLKPGERFQPTEDSLEESRKQLMDMDLIDVTSASTYRFKKLISRHKMHPSVVMFGTPEKEQEGFQATSKKLDPITLLTDAFMLRIPSTPPASSTPRIIETTTTEVIKLNRDLRAMIGDPISTQGVRYNSVESVLAPHINSQDLIQMHLYLLLNDVTMEVSKNAVFRSRLSSLSKDRAVDSIDVMIQQSLFQRLKTQQQETQQVTKQLERVRSEASSARERHKKYEQELLGRVRTLRESVKAGETVQAELEATRKELEATIARERVTDARIGDLEREILVLAAKAQKASEPEAGSQESTGKIEDKRKYSKEVEELTGENTSLRMHIKVCEKEIQELRAKISKLEVTARPEERRLENDIALLTEKIANLEKDARLFSQHAAQRLSAYSNRNETLRKINMALEVKCLDLQAKGPMASLSAS